MVVARVGSRASGIVAKMTVKAAGKMTVNWFAQVVGKMANCLGEKMIMLRVDPRAV